MRPSLPLERVLQVLESRLLLADGAAAQGLERRQLIQLLSVDPVCFLREAGGRARRGRECEQVICHGLLLPEDATTEVRV